MLLRDRAILLAAIAISLLSLSCAPPKDEVTGILTTSPAYDSSVPHKAKFGKLMLRESNGRIYALREAKGFHLLDSAGNRLSEADGRYPIYANSEHRITGRRIEISNARRVLKLSDDPKNLWYPSDADALFDVEVMTVIKVPATTSAVR